MSDSTSQPGPDDADEARDRAIDNANRRVRRGAHWLMWVGALSLINSGGQLIGAAWTFVVGLGITRLLDSLAATAGAGMESEAASTLAVGAAGADLLIAGLFALCGWLGQRRRPRLLVLGAALYVADTLLLVWLGDWLSAAFHLYALVWMLDGLRSRRTLDGLGAS